jgi:hypothetical protein
MRVARNRCSQPISVIRVRVVALCASVSGMPAHRAVAHRPAAPAQAAVEPEGMIFRGLDSAPRFRARLAKSAYLTPIGHRDCVPGSTAWHLAGYSDILVGTAIYKVNKLLPRLHGPSKAAILSGLSKARLQDRLIARVPERMSGQGASP